MESRAAVNLTGPDDAMMFTNAVIQAADALLRQAVSLSS